MAIERWRNLGLTRDEWDGCLEAHRDLTALQPGETVPSPHEIATQLAMAKAAETGWTTEERDLPRRLVPIRTPDERFEGHGQGTS